MLQVRRPPTEDSGSPAKKDPKATKKQIQKNQKPSVLLGSYLISKNSRILMVLGFLLLVDARFCRIWFCVVALLLSKTYHNTQQSMQFFPWVALSIAFTGLGG